MRLRRVVLGALACFLLFEPVVTARAQTGKNELEKVTAFKLKTAGFGPASAVCGLDATSAVEAFSAPLREAGVMILDSSSGYWISLRVTSLTLDSETCITYAETAVFQTTRYFNTATRSERVGTVRHWIDGGYFASSKETHAGVVLRGFHDLGSNLAQRWGDDQSSQ